jgi:hypothetical protein
MGATRVKSSGWSHFGLPLIPFPFFCLECFCRDFPGNEGEIAGQTTVLKASRQKDSWQKNGIAEPAEVI